MGQTASFPPIQLSCRPHVHIFEAVSTQMPSVDTTLCLPPPSQWYHFTQFTISTTLKNGHEKMGILDLVVFTSAILTASNLTHAQKLTDPCMVVWKLLGGGEIVWKEFLFCYAIGLGVSKYLPFMVSIT
jgi:hypothetical protein